MTRNPLHTKLCDILGIEYPIIAFTHCRDVVVAVINAGAFSVYGGAPRTPDELDADIRRIRERIGNKPFGVDLLLPAASPPSATIEELKAQIPETHKRFVAEIKRKYNIPDPKNEPEYYKLGWFSKEGTRRQLEVVLDHKVPVLAFGLGSPEWVLEPARARGMQVWGLVGSPKQAKRELELGVDAIIAQGYDAAGHTGYIGTFSLVPMVAAIAGDTPVIAAGGVTTGRHLAAALCLGAVGVWTGTIWLTSRESDVDMVIKQKLLAATAEDLTHSRSVSGLPMRILRNQWTKEWESPEAPKPLPPPHQMIMAGEVMQAARDYGIEDFMTEAAGQGVGFVTSIKPARQIVFDLIAEATEVFEQLVGELTITS